MKNFFKIFSTMLIIMTIFVLTTVIASAGNINVTVTPSTVSPGDTVKISAGSLPEGYWIGVFPQNGKDDQYIDYTYISDLDTTNTWNYIMPSEPGKYEVRVFNASDEKIATCPTPINSQVSQATLKLSQNKVTPETTISVIVGNVPDTDEYDGTTVLLYKEGSKPDQYANYAYIEDLPKGNTWEVKMPRELGKYYFEVHQNDKYDRVMGKSETVEIVPFTPIIKLDKLSYKVNEPIKISYDEKTVPSFDFEILIAKPDAKDSDYVTYEYSNNLGTDNTYTATLGESGTYQVRFAYTAQTGYVMFGKSQNFTVTDEAFVSDYGNASDWAVTEIEDAQEHNLTTPEVLIDFQKPVTREEFCEMVIKLYENITGKTATPAAANTFTDTTNPEILKAYNLKIVDGMGDGTFDPNASVTREQIAVMFYRCLNVAMPQLDTKVQSPPTFFDSNEISDWAVDAVNYFAFKGIIQGSNGYFLPKANCTSEAAIALVVRTYNEFAKI